MIQIVSLSDGRTQVVLAKWTYRIGGYLLCIKVDNLSAFTQEFKKPG